MSGKFLHAFAEENPELKKQIGCVNGIFHMFDRQLLLTGGRRLDGHGYKKHSSGHPILTTPNRGSEHSAGSPQEKGLRKSLNENQMVCMESSRTSFSSSSCSTFSSPECNKSTQHEALPFEQTIFPNKSSMSSQKLKTANADGRQALNFRDVVKDSINGNSQCLSITTSSREDLKNHVSKHVESLRPMQSPMSMESSDKVDLEESLRALVKLKEEALCSFSDYGESPSTSFEAKAHWLSFDGKEIPRKSLDSRENSKLTSLLQEPQRPSLDGKGSSFETKPNLVVKDSDRSINNQELVSPKCSTSVVAKLMGLEAMPRLSMLTQGPAYNSCKECDPFMEQKLKPLTSSQGNKDYSKMRPISSSRVPIEPAPWRQKVKHHIPHKATVIDREAHAKQHPELVYSEIERKLKQLEFGQSNRDLRALKQILDAMHEKGLLDTKEDEWETTRSNQTFESPIVIMKPANSVKRKSVQPTSIIPLKGLSGIQKLATHATMDKKKATNDHQVEKGQTFSARLKELSNKKSSNRLEGNGSHKVRTETVQVSSRPQQLPRENVRSSQKTLCSLSPKLVGKRFEVESSRPRLPSSHSSNSQRPSSNRKQLESVSPKSKFRQKPAILQNSGKPLNESSKTRNFTCQCDENSQSIETNGSLLSQMDMDVLHQVRRSPSGRVACKTASIKKQKKPSTSLKAKVSSMESVTAPPEQPSPVSVLDASFNQDDLPPSPLKKGSEFSHEIDEKNQTKQSSSKISQKLQSIENLVRKLNELSSTDDKLSTTDHIASLCETQNPDHRYISEILLASGHLFKDLCTGPGGPTPIQLQPSGHPISPDLFLVLEQTKPKPKTKQEELNRRLLFDAVNEALIKKLELTSSGPRRFPSGQQVLKELCLECDRLQAGASGGGNHDDEIIISEGWTNFEKELPKLALEIERSIFKEMIDDIVTSEGFCTSESKSSRRRRQLFTS